jgi:hypothetical protein
MEDDSMRLLVVVDEVTEAAAPPLPLEPRPAASPPPRGGADSGHKGGTRLHDAAPFAANRTKQKSRIVFIILRASPPAAKVAARLVKNIVVPSPCCAPLLINRCCRRFDTSQMPAARSYDCVIPAWNFSKSEGLGFISVTAMKLWATMYKSRRNVTSRIPAYGNDSGRSANETRDVFQKFAVFMSLYSSVALYVSRQPLPLCK